jgi:hypothetical protein
VGAAEPAAGAAVTGVPFGAGVQGPAAPVSSEHPLSEPATSSAVTVSAYRIRCIGRIFEL